MNCLFQDNRSWLVFFSPPRCRFTYPHTGVTADVAQLPPTCCFSVLQLHTCSCRSGRFRSQGPPAGDKNEPPISPAASGRLLCWGARHRRPCEALLCPHERIKECAPQFALRWKRPRQTGWDPLHSTTLDLICLPQSTNMQKLQWNGFINGSKTGSSKTARWNC